MGPLPDRPTVEAGEFGSSVRQTFDVVTFRPAVSDHTLPTFNLVDQSTPAFLNGPVSVRIHAVDRTGWL